MDYCKLMWGYGKVLMPPVSMLGGTMKNKKVKRALALLLACTIVIGSVYNTRRKTYASASAIIAGGGAATVGVEVAFPYLLAITGVVAVGAAVYENRDSIREWGTTQFNKFKNWVNEKKDEFGWWADSAVAGTAIAKWGDRLSSGTLDKSDPTWSAYKDWLKDDVYAEPEIGELNGYPAIPMNEMLPSCIRKDIKYGNYVGITWRESDKIRALYVTDDSQPSGYGSRILVDGNWYYYGTRIDLVPEDSSIYNYIGVMGKDFDGFMDIVNTAVGWLKQGYVPNTQTGEREYTYVGGLSGVLGGAGVLEGDWDVVGVGEAEDEKETKLPWVGSPDLDHTISDVAAGEKTWTDVLDQVGVGVIDRTEEGSKVIDEDGVTTKDWVYADSTTTVPDITIPNEGEVSKELSNYTFAGLEKIFPFCLPFDMIDFIKVLDAPAQAPHFKWSFPYPTTSGMKTYDIDIDLSPFDSVAELLRDMECLLFIMGLILVTRSRMIRG